MLGRGIGNGSVGGNILGDILGESTTSRPGAWHGCQSVNYADSCLASKGRFQQGLWQGLWLWQGQRIIPKNYIVSNIIECYIIVSNSIELDTIGCYYIATNRQIHISRQSSIEN